MAEAKRIEFHPMVCVACGGKKVHHKSGVLCNAPTLSTCPIRSDEHVICIVCNGEGVVYGEFTTPT